MSRPKGSKNKATLEKIRRIPERIKQLESECKTLEEKKRSAEKIIIKQRATAKDLLKQIRGNKREILQLQRILDDFEESQRARAIQQDIQDTVGKLLQSGMSAEEIVQKLN